MRRGVRARRAAAAVAAAVALGCAARWTAGGFVAPRITGTGPPSHVIVVSIAGFTPEALRPRDGSAPVLPTLAVLAAAGARADVVAPVAPPTSVPVHASLATGLRPAHHGIAADLELGDAGVLPMTYTHASQIQGSTLWQAAAAAGRRVVLLGWPSTVGAQAHVVLPELFPMRSGETWQSLLAGAASPEVIEAARRLSRDTPEVGLPGPSRDDLMGRLACQLLPRTAPPTLLMVRFSQASTALAAFGPDSGKASPLLAGADAELRRLVQCIERSGLAETTAFVFTGDHGVRTIRERVNPNVVLAGAGLVDVGRDGAPTGWSAFSRSNGGSAFVYARDEAAALAARRALEAEAARTSSFRLVTAREMIELGADPQAWFGLEGTPGIGFGNAAVGPVVAPAAGSLAAGGYLSADPALSPGFAAFGRGVRAGVRIASMRQIDVAPTVARLLGVALDGAEGVALEAVAGAAPPVASGAGAEGLR
jgi:hypothetical protein